MSSTTGSIGSASASSSPPCPTCGVNVEAAFSKIDTARRKLQLRQETLHTEQALLKADKRNFKRRLQAAKAAAANSQIASERIHAESVKSEQAAKRKHQEYQQQLEEGSEKQKEIERQHSQEIQSLKQEFEELVSLQKKEENESNNANISTSGGGASPSEQELTECHKQIERLQRELENKESALESCEMQLFELERERDEGYSNNNNGDDNSENDHGGGYSTKFSADSNTKICFNCSRLEPRLEQAEQDLTDLRIAKETEESRLSCQITKLREQTLALKINQVESQEDTNELKRLREELKELKTLEQDKESTIALQKQQLGELTESNKALLDQQQFRDAIAANNTDNNNSNSDGDAALRATIQQRPPEPDEKTHRHVMEFEWHGSNEAGVYTGWLLKATNNPDGSGTLRLAEGDVYDGDWKDGKRHGHGVFVTLDGDIYNGGWTEGAYHGYGVFVWSAGKIYRGDYVNGERHGQAVMTWPYGANYQGEYANDKRNGKGIYVYADGRCYTGEYRDEKPHGYGQLKATDGTIIYDGAWEFGEYLGR
jgi:hypothetical protein